MALIKNSVVNAGGNPVMLQGLAVDIPQAGVIGRLFVATDTLIIYRDSGSTWDVVGGGSVPSLQQVTNAGNVTTNQMTVNNGSGTNVNINNTGIEILEDAVFSFRSEFKNNVINIEDLINLLFINITSTGIKDETNNPNLVYSTDGGRYSLSEVVKIVDSVDYTGNVAAITLGNLFVYNNAATSATQLLRVSINIVVSSIAVATTFKITGNYNAFIVGTIDLIPVNQTTSVISGAGLYSYSFVTSINGGQDLLINSVSVAGAGVIVYDYTITVEFLKNVYLP